MITFEPIEAGGMLSDKKNIFLHYLTLYARMFMTVTKQKPVRIIEAATMAIIAGMVNNTLALRVALLTDHGILAGGQQSNELFKKAEGPNCWIVVAKGMAPERLL